MKNKLPDKPSDLILLALNDLVLVEENPAYQVFMGSWHDPHETGCQVCLAGAIMSMTLKAHVHKYMDPQEYDKDTRQKLEALDNFRMGLVEYGLMDMGIHKEVGDGFDIKIPNYVSNQVGFKQGMRKLAMALSDHGY